LISRIAKISKITTNIIIQRTEAQMLKEYKNTLLAFQDFEDQKLGDFGKLQSKLAVKIHHACDIDGVPNINRNHICGGLRNQYSLVIVAYFLGNGTCYRNALF
jgi:hypothetical protein